MSADTCLLCEARGAKERPGRLGRYARTCDACEARRGSHLGTPERMPVAAQAGAG
jgi:hypothetical protein